MIDLHKPDWVQGITTGIVGFGFCVNKEYDLAFLSSSPTLPSPLPETLMFFVMKGGLRDFPGEALLFSKLREFGKLSQVTFGPGKVLAIASKDIGDLFRSARKVLRKAKVA